ncbi:hypothetical protein COV17_03870 [Candidatus Woesearchaeota archaeon CG10_big_fil_rev_8_21_14_0_10_36_11]|nr:MAG: hypothetical protein COV17_03870 [Candidatus Woesearchaeota archaeon CG10_big_fil_rev_8_21_14_0_10_36_11]
MSLSLLPLLFSITGILFGYILARIAPEELNSGKKYFILLQHVLYGLIVILTGYYLYNVNLVILFVWVSIAVAFFILKLKIKTKYKEIGSYIIFAVPYFINTSQTFQLLLVTLIFLYGFPFGTLLKKIN